MSKLLGLDDVIRTSIVPKSLTTAIGIAISEYGGIQAITIVCMVITGMGSGCGSIVMKLVNVTDPVAQGVGIGTSSHAAGTSKPYKWEKCRGYERDI